uniref:C2 domain-containing protein n=1 Tax=Opuntia streptacantha TaxID=393608 RepID=A0A7C9D3R2_OPUST
MIKQEEQHSRSPSMGKIWVEVCLISARGLPRSSLWKLQWYAVGWVDPNNKYCTKIEASGTPNPVWKTKFTTVIDVSESEFQNMQLHIEVYSREPLFLREKLQGTATVSLREFLANYSRKSEGLNEGNEDVGSFQLRKKNSDKPLGFIDVSIRVSEEKEIASSYSYLGKEEGFNLRDGSSSIPPATNTGPMQVYPARQSEPPFHLPGKPHPPPPVNHPYAHPARYPTSYSNPPISGPGYPSPTGPSYPQPPRTPPPPPPPSNVGYIPTFMPHTNNQPTSYINMPSSGAGMGRGIAPGFGAGLGAGALAAGAVIFGDDFMSGFALPSGTRHGSLTISTVPPF